MRMNSALEASTFPGPESEEEGKEGASEEASSARVVPGVLTAGAWTTPRQLSDKLARFLPPPGSENWTKSWQRPTPGVTRIPRLDKEPRGARPRGPRGLAIGLEATRSRPFS